MTETESLFTRITTIALITTVVAASLMLASCSTTSTEKAEILPGKASSAKAEQARLAQAPTPARMPAERYDGQLVAAAADAAPGEAPTALPGVEAPAATVAVTEPAAQPEAPANLQELVMQPTGADAGNGSIFSSQQTAYAPGYGETVQQGSTSLVPANLPARAGINPSSTSLFSAPRQAQAASTETYPTYAAAEPAPMAASEQLVTPEPAPAYDPAEPAPTEATPQKKSFSLMRMLGRKGT